MTLFKDILTSQDLIIELLFITLYPVNLKIIMPKTRCIGFFTTFVLLMLSLKSIGQLQQELFVHNGNKPQLQISFTKEISFIQIIF